MCTCPKAPDRPDAVSRRGALRLLGAAGLAPALGGCDQVASILVPRETVVDLGIETWRRLRQQMRPAGDPALSRRVEGIALRVLEAAGEDPGRWELAVFADPQINAFVLPGNKIGVLEGMVRFAGSDAELAAVIGHEIGHLEADHPQERMAAEVVQQWALRMVSFLLEVNEVAFAQEIAGLLGVGAEFGLVRPYGRRQELEADRLGVFMMARAGYDPREAAMLWQRMDERGGSGLPAMLSTHPAPATRIEEILELVPEARRAMPAAGRADALPRPTPAGG